MTRGFICDLCGQIQTGTSTPAATYEHRVLLADDDGNELYGGKRVQVEADFCDECAADLSRRFHIYPGQQHEADEEDDE